MGLDKIECPMCKHISEIDLKIWLKYFNKVSKFQHAQKCAFQGVNRFSLIWKPSDLVFDLTCPIFELGCAVHL